jgi:hypothetical protein
VNHGNSVDYRRKQSGEIRCIAREILHSGEGLDCESCTVNRATQGVLISAIDGGDADLFLVCDDCAPIDFTPTAAGWAVPR